MRAPDQRECDVISTFSYSRRLATEAIGTALLLAAVVGSGIMGERLAGGNGAIALLANSLATGAVLVALIVAFGPISGAHFNPVVTLAQGCRSALPFREIPGYIVAQVGGAFLGVVIAHAMFGEPILTASLRARSGLSMVFSEVVATLGLVSVVWSTSRSGSTFGSVAVAGYVTGAYWFTSSTCFANPAVTLARAATDTFAGIRPADVPIFIVAQLVGGAVAVGYCRWVFGSRAARRTDSTHAGIEPEKVVFACIHNAGRSQMAAAFFNALADPERAHAVSAGTRPSSRVHEGVVHVMREVGIDLEGMKPQLLTFEIAREAELLITMGCHETCPNVPGLRQRDWTLEDPKGLRLDEVRSIRDDVRARVQRLVETEGWGAAGAGSISKRARSD